MKDQTHSTLPSIRIMRITMRMTHPVDRIIGLFGGMTPLARALGHTNPTTVQGWKARGIIPARQQANVLEAAGQLGIPLRAEDLISPSRIERAA
jgi:hypothetical protein